MAPDQLPGQMRAAAATLLAALDGEQRALAALPFADDAARRWLEYRPERRPGACLGQFSGAARKAAHRLLATGLGDHAYAQAMAIIALEEVLDRQEGWARGRHSNDYWVSVFGEPGGDGPWSWRFEGHHLSVSMTVLGEQVSPAPVFLGANPATVSYAGRPVSRPLAPEEDLARALLEAMGPAGRAVAVIADRAPADIRTGTSARAADGIEPLGIGAGRLGPGARALLGQLAALYLERLPAGLAAREAARIGAGELHFAWEGPVTPGSRWYYRVQGDDLLIEYDNTVADGHAHTVLRRPRSDFGDDVLAAHYRRAHA
ncbi:MAG: DUF3500 domain-containing protein [Actinobacteria bacterium]|nr:DUF3500 domain-containing protein [Actinomycetota bacterium]MBO0786324.1 DUF3500 domain-containing protein [Actinomycetota bacterium]